MSSWLFEPESWDLVINMLCFWVILLQDEGPRVFDTSLSPCMYSSQHNETLPYISTQQHTMFECMKHQLQVDLDRERKKEL